jgi:Mn2+/Fe2+ NRAMP family transporter
MNCFSRQQLGAAEAFGSARMVTAIYGEQGTARLLILSQAVLSMQLSFAVIPLVQFLRPQEDGATSPYRERCRLQAGSWLESPWSLKFSVRCLAGASYAEWFVSPINRTEPIREQGRI